MKHGYVYVGVGVAIVTIGVFLIYQLESKPLEQKTVAVPTYEDYKPLTFTALNVSPEEAKNLQRKVCGNGSDASPTPGKVNFVYLEPKYQVFRIGCYMNPDGVVYRFYAVSENNQVISVNTNANVDSDIFQVKTPLQAIEYVDFHISELEASRLALGDYSGFCGPTYGKTASLISVIISDDYYLVKTYVAYNSDVGTHCGPSEFKISKNGNYMQLS